MTGYVWRRQALTSTDTLFGTWWIDAIPAGSKYVRCRFRWSFYGDSPFEVDLQSYAENQIYFGLVTTYGNGSETPPNPITQSNDQSPPAQRWIYWEVRSPHVTAMSKDGGVVTWRDDGSTEPTDTKSQVAAAAPPTGDTLNLWATWACTVNWAADLGNSRITIGISDLSYHP